jgi:hypothetical protein
MPKLRLAFGAWLAFAATLFAADSGRFSQAVKPEERTPAGLHRLDSDQVAVLDALVRRDTAARASLHADPEAPATFSERLTANEREITGITLLTGEELPRLNALIERYAAATLARSLLGPTTYVPRASRIEAVERRDRKNIHGTFSLSYGVGRGGYSERTGSMVVNYDDPEGRYSITIGYSESHVKGGPGYGVYRNHPGYDIHPYRPGSGVYRNGPPYRP